MWYCDILQKGWISFQREGFYCPSGKDTVEVRTAIFVSVGCRDAVHSGVATMMLYVFIFWFIQTRMRPI